MTLPKIYCAIDTDNLQKAKEIAGFMAKAKCGIKLGMEFFNTEGPQGIAAIREAFPDISLFIDLKYHDIPNTVAGAVRSITRLAPDFLNVHAAGGTEMMKAAKNAMQEEAQKRSIKTPKLLAVTVLTSMDETAVSSVGWALPIADQVKRLALLTQQAGLDGVVCSPLEVALVRATCGNDFATMVPGIRPVASNDDQKRVMTPKMAVEAGVHHMVIGRPITGSPDPVAAAQAILAEIA